MDREEFINEFSSTDIKSKDDMYFNLDKLNTEAISHDSLHFNFEGKHIRGLTSLVIFMEEMSELQKEMSKVIRNKGDRFNILEELADVSICIERIKLLLNISDEELYKAMQVKMNRFEKRLKQENEEFDHSS